MRHLYVSPYHCARRAHLVYVTHLNDQQKLNQHLLSYLKLRWANAHMRVNDPRTDFLAWLGPNGHTIDGPTTTTLNGYGFITPVTLSASLTPFVAANLPADGESTTSFLTRFQFSELNNMGGGNIVDDAAAQILVNQLTPVGSGGVVAAWNMWFPTDPANPGRTFPQQLAAFKQHLMATNRVPTGHAVVTLAVHCGFNYQGWVAGQLANIINGAPGNAITLPKVHEEAACWNWALTACTPMNVTPDQVINWLHSPLSTPELAPLANAVQNNHIAARQVLRNAKQAMHANGLATMVGGFDANWSTNPAKVNLVQQINEWVYAAMVELYGFSVQNAPTGLAVAIEYRNSDGVSWEHWWVEDHGLVIETFPRMRFTLQATNQTQVQRMGPVQQAQYSVVRIPVQALMQTHLDTIHAGMAQYL